MYFLEIKAEEVQMKEGGEWSGRLNSVKAQLACIHSQVQLRPNWVQFDPPAFVVVDMARIYLVLNIEQVCTHTCN